jgi:hypothetical protein
MSQTQAPSILDRFFERVTHTVSLENARAIAELRADPDDQARIDELADKCNEGLLTDEELEEYDEYLQAIHVIGIVQRAAQRVLASGAQP